MARLRPLLVILLLGIYIAGGMLPAWRKVRAATHARDYATYHYAVQEAWDDGSPYDTSALSQRARAERTRQGVHPYFYPPPFLIGLLWAVPMSLGTAAAVWFWLNQICLFASLAVLRRWFHLSPLIGVGLLASFTPLWDNAKMGQANVAVMLLAIAGLHWRSGLLVAGAAMSKMSPALYLAAWAAQRDWRPVLVAMLAAIGLSVLALPLVHAPEQLAFYTEILPGFASGDYHGLKVPVTLPANHSIPDIFNQLWPGPDKHTISSAAQHTAQICSLALLAGLSWLARHRRDRHGEACIAGAFTVLLVITPVYTYEHHFSMLLLPLAAVAAAVARGRLSRRWWPVLAVSYGAMAWPLWMLRSVQKQVPDLHWWLQESKFIAVLVLLIACVQAARSAPIRAPDS